jgi:nitroreductase
MNFDLTQTDHLLSTTRAVRKRLDLTRPVPRDLILDCVRLSTQAPAGGNNQKWRWVIVDDPAKKAVIANAYRRTYAPYIASQQRAVAAAGNGGEKNAIMDSSNYLADVLQDVPALAIPCALGSPADMGNVKGSQQGWWGSVIPAVWSYCLAARSRGLGTVWTTLHLGFDEEVGEALGIPNTVTQLGCIPTAFYTGDDFKPASRKPAEQITYWNSWKQTEIGTS